MRRFAQHTDIPAPEATLVRKAFQEAADGVSYEEIAERMDSSTWAVRSMLTNPVYAGDLFFRRGGVRIRNHHTPLVSRELWENVNRPRRQERKCEHEQ